MSKRKGVLLTKTVVDDAGKARKRYHVWDSDLAGFGLRVEPTGAKTFIAKYRANGGGRNATQRVVTIGRFGTVTTDQARKQAKKILGGAAVVSISVQLGPTISVQTGPVPAVALDGHARFLMRQLSLPVSMMSQ